MTLPGSLTEERSYVTVRASDVPLLAHVHTFDSPASVTTVLAVVSPLASPRAVAKDIAAMVATGRRVVVVDHPGTGGSDPWAGSQHEWVDLVGGAVDATELVALGPVAGSSPELALLADRLIPRRDGAHLAAAIDAVRAAWVFAPWHERTAAARRQATVPGAAALHDGALRLLESPSTLAARGAWFDALGAHRFAPTRAAQSVDPPRSYANTRFGQIHVCTYGPRTQQPSVLALHPSPGSARPYAHVAHQLSGTRRVIAPDMLGNGASDAAVMHHALVDALSPEFGDQCGTSRTLADYADEAVAVLDALGEGLPVDIWGNHTGALIGMELAIRYPRRVRRLVMDGITMFDAAETADILARYLPPFELDEYGSHLFRAWGMRHDMSLFWPWYRTNADGFRATGAVPTDVAHANTMELLRSGPSFRVAYDAAFRYPTARRLPLVTVPTLLTVIAVDPLAGAADEVARLLPTLQRAGIGGYGPDHLNASVAVITDFLDAAVFQ